MNRIILYIILLCGIISCSKMYCDEVEILNCEVSYPTSATSQNLTITFKNKSDKTIKDISFFCKFYSGFGTECGIGFQADVNTAIEPNRVYTAHWSCPLYNWNIRKVKIEHIKVFYKGNTKYDIYEEGLFYLHYL